MEHYQATVPQQRIPAHLLSTGGSQEPAMAIERLPFTVRRVESDHDLRKAVHVRHSAYLRHIPEFAETLVDPEENDYDDDTVVLLAESKLDGSPLGSARIRHNLRRSLAVEESIVLPAWLQSRRVAEVSRLSVGEGRIGQVVKAALLKACVAYCEQNHIEWALATGRAPIDRHYERLMFVDVFEDKAPVPLKHVGNIPHRVMAFEIGTMDARWTAANHPMLGFFCRTRHPDIEVGARNGWNLDPLRPAASHRLMPSATAMQELVFA